MSVLLSPVNVLSWNYLPSALYVISIPAEPTARTCFPSELFAFCCSAITDMIAVSGSHFGARYCFLGIVFLCGELPFSMSKRTLVRRTKAINRNSFCCRVSRRHLIGCAVKACQSKLVSWKHFLQCLYLPSLSLNAQ